MKIKAFRLVASLVLVCLSFTTTGSQASEPLRAEAKSPPAALGAVSYPTAIHNITKFLEVCPTKDPAYQKFRNDFVVLIDGVKVGDIPCTSPMSTLPISQLTDALYVYQVMRAMYYMDMGIPNFYPWTEKSLYDWMVSTVRGVNLKTAPGQLYCCDYINGEKYISQSMQDDVSRESKRSWIGISSSMAYLAHEARHADGGPGHVTGCAVFPDPNGPLGCDEYYDPANLGSYGVQYWLNYAWMTGAINLGFSCSNTNAFNYMYYHFGSVNNTFRGRFVKNIPAIVPMPEMPYGGPCMLQIFGPMIAK